MKLSEIKNRIAQLEHLLFELPNGTLVPEHFHVTEVGVVTKKFIDCGGVIRQEEVINFQLWEANDYNHRLHPEKLLHIIDLSEKALNLKDLDVEVEYQGETIGRYDVSYDGDRFTLLNKNTACLAQDQCGIPAQKPKVKISQNTSCCDPASGCC